MRMSTIHGRRHGRGRDGERGAVATVVAIFFAGGVIMAMLAISVDLGNLTYERRQVQNAADATSLALASKCASDAAECDPTLPEVAGLLGANAHDSAMQYSSDPNLFKGACARGDATLVGPLDVAECTSTADISELLQCPPVPQWLADETGIPYVETYADTQTASGNDALFLPFSRVLVGGSASGDAGTSACARAAWGTPDGYSSTLPLTFSGCEWDRQTSKGTNYVSEGPQGASPGYGGAGQPAWPGVAREVVIQFHEPKDETSDCTWNGKDTSGGFGWLESDANCQTLVNEDDWAHIDPGNNVPQKCKDDIAALLNTVVDIPVFDCIVAASTAPTGPPPSAAECDPTQKQSSGSNSYYHLAGWAKFYVSGYRLSGVGSGSTMPGGNTTCGGGGGRCLMGWFLTGALADAPGIRAPGPPGTGGNFGTYVIKPAG